MTSLTPLVVILGPTGSGKSDLSILIAGEFGGEIVNCDSIQVYSDLNVGSAKLPVRERKEVPHHLIDILPIREKLTAGEYSRLARTVLQDIKDRNQLPVVVGGTGFYLRALLEGLSPAPARDPHLRSRLELIARRKPFTLHRYLRFVDPKSAARIHPRDRQKLIRAIELSHLSRMPASAIQAAPREPLTGFRVLKIGLDPERSLLYTRLNQRAAWMFGNGLLEETKRILDSGVGPGIEPLRSLGYKQAVGYLQGQLPLADAIAECQVRTRHYAKRQMTWFRMEPNVNWLSGFGYDPEIQSRALDLTRDFLVSAKVK